MIFATLITITATISAKPALLSTSDILSQLEDEVQFVFDNPSVPLEDALPSLDLLHPAVHAQLAYEIDGLADKYEDSEENVLDPIPQMDFYISENSAAYFSKFIDEAPDAAIAEIMDRMQANIEGMIDTKFSDLVNMSEKETAQTLFKSLERFDLVWSFFQKI